MTNKFSQYITKHEVVAPKSNATICSFCHFDAREKIAPYVVHYLKELKEAGCDTYFVSNNEYIAEEYLAEIRPYVTDIVLRVNEGYDFAAYFTGYYLAKDKGYERLIFANDSAYGPFYALAETFEHMAGFDMWGISDAYAGRYHIQSYFWMFNLTPRMKEFMDRKLNDFVFTSVKEMVVNMYEEGISQAILEEGFNVGVLCMNERAEEIERNSNDPELKSIKAGVASVANLKVKPWLRMLAIVNPKRRAKNANKINMHTYGTGIFSCWYTLVKYMDCPFIKVGMVKKHSMEKFHDFKYPQVIGAKYPAYDLNLIENHRKGLY